MDFFSRLSLNPSSNSGDGSRPESPTAAMTDSDPRGSPPVAAIFKLPPEIIQQVLSYLDVQHLVSLSRVCHDLKTHTEENRLWIDLLRPHIPPYDLPSSPHPAPSFRKLYLAHHPYWFLPRHKIWFSDDAYNGKLIVIKFDARKGSIEGYRLAAERPPAYPEIWSYKPSVIIHRIDPQVYASTEDPVLSLPYAALPYHQHQGASAWIRGNSTESSEGQFSQWLLSNEPRMRVGRANQKIHASLLLSRDLPAPTSNSLSVSVWPPRTIPDMPRVRSSNSSSDKFASRGHKPTTLDEISQTTFRLRTWSHFMQGMAALGVRIGEEISTWSTLSEDLYKPTPEKPYQGIFVGDYASHGCEFLLVLQTERAPDWRSRTNPEEDQEGTDRPSNYIRAVLAALRDELMTDEELEEAAGPGHATGVKNENVHMQTHHVEPNVLDGEDYVVHKGAIEAIKLTGDVNVPRGEHTFIADDIGPSGTIRIAHERPFRGARVVKSRGHVAARGFRDDEFIPSQLFLISPDLLAQYWLPFGHISFYKRIDVDELLRNASNDRRASE